MEVALSISDFKRSDLKKSALSISDFKTSFLSMSFGKEEEADKLEVFPIIPDVSFRDDNGGNSNILTIKYLLAESPING